MSTLQQLNERFFQDPMWAEVEKMILKFVEPLADMSTVDLTQPAEHVKAEIIGRIKAHDALMDFLNTTKVISRPPREIKQTFQ
jgi:hypothetical protein